MTQDTKNSHGKAHSDSTHPGIKKVSLICCSLALGKRHNNILSGYSLGISVSLGSVGARAGVTCCNVTQQLLLSRGMKPSFQAGELSQCAPYSERSPCHPTASTQLQRIRSVMGVHYLNHAISTINNLTYLLKS